MWRDALRLASWRAPRAPDARLSGLAMAGLFAFVGVLAVAAEFVAAHGAFAAFSPYGLNALLAGLALSAGVILAFSHVDRTQATARHLMLAFVGMALVSACEGAIFQWIGFYSTQAKLPMSAYVAAWVATAITYVWSAGAARQAFKPRVRRPTLRAAGFLAALLLCSLALPGWPVFAPPDFNRQTANLWEYYRAYAYAKQYAAQQQSGEAAKQRAAEAEAARLEAEQPSLLRQAVAKLAPRDPAQANVFTVGVAGWGYQDVFLKEIRQSTDILKAHFKLGDRTLNLINNAATAKTAPMASMANLGEALSAVAARMDLDKDLFVLVLSSHGSPDGFALSYDNHVERTLDPETLKLMLDAAGIKRRVIIVSSCYSGTFVAPLRNPDTMILTAASADRTSFGCSDDRHWTWFGEALFEKALAERATLADAFVAAKATIGKWEREQSVAASNPQIFVGEAIAQKFPDIVGAPPSATLGALAPAPPRPRPGLSAGTGAL